MSKFSKWFERCSEKEVLADYCLWEYEPLASMQGKQRSINLLYNSFDAAGVGVNALPFIQQIQSVMGKGNTVWGVKLVEGRISWEFYFYDYERLERRNSVSRLLNGMSERIRCPLEVNEASPYFMFSIDLSVDDLNAGSAELDEINIYMGNDGSDVSSGICYALTSQGLALHNLYYFYDTANHAEDIVAKLACSAHLDLYKLDLQQLLIPQLANCQTTVVANKKFNEGIYFSRINVQQLLWFVENMGYPSEICHFISEQQTDFSHMLYDVGIDYRMLPNGQIDVLKTSYYGIL